jgi:hypothetical protein
MPQAVEAPRREELRGAAFPPRECARLLQLPRTARETHLSVMEVSRSARVQSPTANAVAASQPSGVIATSFAGIALGVALVAAPTLAMPPHS